MLPIFRSLLYLYPSDYRQQYGDEMLSVLGDVNAGTRHQTARARVVSNGREVAGLLLGALREHTRKLGAPQDFSVFPQRRLTMRSDFRFPKSTVTLMTIIFVAIVVAIEKAKTIQQSVVDVNPPLVPTHPAHVTIVSTLLIALAAVAVAAALGWAAVFALHRSGIQRLSDLKPPASTQRSSS